MLTHKSLFWVPILAAGGPYFTKSWVPIGSLFQSLGVPISLSDSGKGDQLTGGNGRHGWGTFDTCCVSLESE